LDLFKKIKGSKFTYENVLTPLSLGRGETCRKAGGVRSKKAHHKVGL